MAQAQVRSRPTRKNGEMMIDKLYPRLLCDRKAVSIAGANGSAAFRLGAAAITLIFSFLSFLDSRLPLCWPFAISIPLGFEDRANGAQDWKTGNAQLAGLSARRVEIVLRFEPRCQIKHTGAIEIVRFRAWSADTRGPSISVVKNKQRHF
jgi:hypothetical protein